MKILPPKGTVKIRHFDGPNYDPELDYIRLTKQNHKVWALMFHGDWVFPEDIGELIGCGTASVTTHMRDFRKPRWGNNIVLKRRRKEGGFLYRLVYNRLGTIKHRDYILRKLEYDLEDAYKEQPRWIDPRYDDKISVIKRYSLRIKYRDILPSCYTGYGNIKRYLKQTGT